MSSKTINEKTYNNPETNPCLKEQEESLYCLNVTNNKDKCYLEFLNYRDCKAFWSGVCKKRAEKGVQPLMPTQIERKQIIDFLGDQLPYIPL